MTQYNNRIVTDGLQICVDFTNPKSFSGIKSPSYPNLAAVSNLGSGLVNANAGNCTKIDLGGGKFRFVGTSTTLSPKIQIFPSSSTALSLFYWSSVWYEEYTGSTPVSINFGGVQTTEGTISSSAASGRLKMLAQYTDLSKRYFEIVLEIGSSIILYDPMWTLAVGTYPSNISGCPDFYYETSVTTEEVKSVVNPSNYTFDVNRPQGPSHVKSTLPTGLVHYPPVHTPTKSQRYFTTTNLTYTYAITMSAWVKRYSSTNSYNMFMGSVLPYFCFLPDNRFMISAAFPTQYSLHSVSTYSDNTWYHATATITGRDMHLYVDGVLNASSTVDGLGVFSTTANKLCIFDGRESNWYPFHGEVSKALVYNRVLTASEVLINFNAHKADYGK